MLTWGELSQKCPRDIDYFYDSNTVQAERTRSKKPEKIQSPDESIQKPEKDHRPCTEHHIDWEPFYVWIILLEEEGAKAVTGPLSSRAASSATCCRLVVIYAEARSRSRSSYKGRNVSALAFEF